MKIIYVSLVAFSLCLLSNHSFAQPKTSSDSLILYGDLPGAKRPGLNHEQYAQLVKSTVVIIDKKIYKIDSKEYKQMLLDADKNKDLWDLQLINDEQSGFEIKTVLVFTKKQPR